MEPEVRALWEQWRETQDPEVRERLILQYSPLVKYVAGRVGVGMPSSVEHGDLVSYGIFGLMDAIDKFDLDKGFKFETYAITRIRGAIIDELRSNDWVPRSVRANARKIERAIAGFENEHSRSPTDEELADLLGITEEDLAGMLTKISLTNVAALDEQFGSGDGERLSLVDTITDPDADSPESSFDQVEMRDMLGQAIGRLSERERTVLGLYYFEGMTLAQIGEILGVTESRVCQIHTKSVMSLRAKLQARISG